MDSFKEKMYVEIIEMLLKNNGNPNINVGRNTPLIDAIMIENIKLVEMLLDNGADPNIRDEIGYTPLNVACGSDETFNLEIIKLLLERDAEPNDSDEETNLFWVFSNDEASTEQKFAATKLLLEHGYDLNKLDEDGELLNDFFYLLDDDDNLEILKLCMEYGLDLNYFTDERKYYGNLITIPSKNDQIKTLKFILDNDIDPNISKEALIIAVKNNNIEIVRLLLEYGADPNVQNGLNDTPLTTAMVERNLKMMSILLDSGADPHFVWYDEYRPDINLNMIQYAKRIGHNGVLQLLESYILEKEKEQNIEQRLATSMALNPRLGQDSIFNSIDESGLFDRIASYVPEYNSRYAPDIGRRMIEEYNEDPLTKSKQHLATMKGIRDRNSVLQYLREPELMENVNEYLSSMRPQPSVQNRMMLEDKQMGRGKRSKKQGKKSSKKQGKQLSKT